MSYLSLLPHPNHRSKSVSICHPISAEALLLVLALVVSRPALAQDFSGVAIDFNHDDNLSLATAGQQVGGSSGELSLWHGYHWQLTGYTGLELTGTLARRQVMQVSALSATRIGVSAALQHKFGLGDKSLVFTLGSNIEHGSFNDSRRDAWRYQINAGLRRRISQQWQWSLIGSYQKQDGDLDDPRVLPPPLPALPGNVWDLQAWQLAAAVEWDVGPAWWLNATLTHRHGDIVSSVTPPTPLLFASRAVSGDPAFGSNIVAYRLAATTDTLAIDWNLAISDSSTCYVGVERRFSHGSGSLSYGAGIIRAGFIHNF